MGRKGDGVEIHGSAIRLSFTLDGQRKRPLLMIDGKPLQPTAANMKYARRVAQEVRERIRHGTFNMAEYFPASGAGSGLTVKGWLDTWLDTQSVENSTKAGYESAVNFWNNAAALVDRETKAVQATVGSLSLRTLKPSHLLTAIAQRPDLTGKTVNNYVSVIRQALDLAVADKIIKENPASEVPRQKHQKPPPDPFTRAEAEAIIADMAKHYPEQVYNMVEAWFFSGPRTSEVFGQRWPNVDLFSAKLAIVEAVVRGEQKDSTKTNVARDVLLNSRALAALNRQAKHTRMVGEHVWHDPRYGTPWTEERAFRRSYWTPCLKRLGIRYRRPYNMRHTYATMMLMAGMTPAFCARQLGHSIEMFLRTYAKWLDGAQNDLEMARFEATLGADLPQIRPKAKGSST
ncbi:Arm DNA-binding domain-containing protein [Bordetella hinzii]|uniref:Arm DNA-binding domain-containing protein n=1 Tax=Bordetella hinzii TaxID=103855 RepID=UPI0039FD8C03